jgi:hypothetical protein
MRSATIIGLPDARLKEHLGITEGEVYVFDPYLQLAYVEEPLRQRFGCDVVLLNENLLGGWQAYHLPVGKPAKTCADFRTEPDVSGGEYSLDEQGRRTWYRPPGGYYFDALKPKVSVFLHSCGAIFDLIPGLIDAGLDILNPVQISARGMQPERLKSEFGERLCLWGGGCDTQRVLPFGTPEKVYEHTWHNVEVFKPGGGYVFSQVHNIQVNVPPENVVAMFEAVRDEGKY